MQPPSCPRSLASQALCACLQVVVSDILPDDQMAPVVEKIHKLGREAISLQCDVRDRKAVDDAVKRAADHFGSLDILCANAGGASVLASSICY